MITGASWFHDRCLKDSEMPVGSSSCVVRTMFSGFTNIEIPKFISVVLSLVGDFVRGQVVECFDGLSLDTIGLAKERVDLTALLMRVWTSGVRGRLAAVVIPAGPGADDGTSAVSGNSSGRVRPVPAAG